MHEKRYNVTMDKLYYSWDDLNRDCRIIVREMAHESYKPEVIIGPGRGAYAFGVMMSHYFEDHLKHLMANKRRKSTNRTLIKAHFTKYNDKHVLVVDDINDTGTTLKAYIK